MTTLPDGPMQSLLRSARRYSTEPSSVSSDMRMSPPISIPDNVYDGPRRSSNVSNHLLGEQADRRLSEAGVNRRPSAVHVLTEDTDSFIIGERVYVDGVKAGRIQFIGETKFGPGEWAGVFLEESLGKNDGSVGNTRYFQCEPYHGVFSRLYRLTREPIEGAEEVLSQMKRYGYEIVEAPLGRRGSIGSGGGTGSRRGSMCFDDSRRGSIDRGSLSPRHTPEPRRSSLSRSSPDPACPSHGRRGSGVGIENRRTSLTVPERRPSGNGLMAPNSPRGRRVTPGKSPLASPSNSRSNLGLAVSNVKIDKDPEISKLTQEARRLSMGGTGRRGSGLTDHLTEEIRKVNGRKASNPRRPSEHFNGRLSSPRRTSESSSSNGSSGGGTRHPSDYSPLTARRPNYSPIIKTRHSENSPSIFSKKKPESLGLMANSRRGSDVLDGSRRGSFGVAADRRPSSELEASELLHRRQSEAGLRRKSATDVVLNEDTESLMVGQTVWVDGTKRGRIAYIGNVHFAKGDMAGIHLEEPIGKNNGTVGGIMYFQCEPKRGIFSRLHRLTTQPLYEEQEEYDEY